MFDHWLYLWSQNSDANDANSTLLQADGLTVIALMMTLVKLLPDDNDAILGLSLTLLRAIGSDSDIDNDAILRI